MFGDANETAQLANNFSRMSTSNVQPPVPSTINQQSPGFTSTAMAVGTTTTFSNAPFANQNNQFYTRKSRVDPTPFQLMDTTKPLLEENQVDSWIDYLDATKPPRNTAEVKMEDSLATWLVQQGLPRIKIPWFDGSPEHYVEFTTSFKDLVHDQNYLSTLQKCVHLHQAVKEEVKRSIQGYRNDHEGYVMALKRIKYMFGQRSRISEAVITKVVNHKPIANRDQNALTEFYYTLSDCLVTLRKLNYASDLYSTDILRQTCRKLPQFLLHKWADHCLTLRRTCEPNLNHLEAWLQERILASKDSYLPRRAEDRTYPPDNNNKRQNDGNQRKWTGTVANKPKKQKVNVCCLCKEEHRIHKCPKFVVMDASERFETAKKMKLCYNCLTKDHFTSQCKSKNSCFNARCTERHHTCLHEYFTEHAKEVFNGKTQTATSEGTVYLSVVPVKL